MAKRGVIGTSDYFTDAINRFDSMNQSIELDRKDAEKPKQQGYSNIEKSSEKTCFTCKNSKSCRIFKSKMGNGSFSIDSKKTGFTCDDWKAEDIKKGEIKLKQYSPAAMIKAMKVKKKK